MNYTKTIDILFTLEHPSGGGPSGWLAQCLQHDIAAQGETLRGAREAFERALVTQVFLDLTSGLPPLDHLESAPVEIWEAFALERSLVTG